MKIARGLVIAFLLLPITFSAAAAAPEGQLTWGVHISLAPTYPNGFDAGDYTCDAANSVIAEPPS